MQVRTIYIDKAEIITSLNAVEIATACKEYEARKNYMNKSPLAKLMDRIVLPGKMYKGINDKQTALYIFREDGSLFKQYNVEIIGGDIDDRFVKFIQAMINDDLGI